MAIAMAPETPAIGSWTPAAQTVPMAWKAGKLGHRKKRPEDARRAEGKRLRYQATIHAKKRTKYSNIPIYVRAGGQIQDANISADFRIRPVVARIVWKAFRRF